MSVSETRQTASIALSGDNQVNVKGVLNFETVPVLMKQAEQLLIKLDNARVSFTDVEDSNSAGIALLLEMARFMKVKNKLINFHDLPEQVLIMAHAYGIDAELNEHLESADFLSA